jgi:hypothetical protein
MRLALIPLLALTAMPVSAQQYPTQTREYGECTKIIETYVPGSTINGYYRRGYIKTQKVNVNCNPTSEYVPSQQDNNSCIEGSVLGGILGGGIGAAASRGDGRWWAIPTGIVGGALIGCQVDGG